MKKLAALLFGLLAGCTVNHIVPYAYIVGDAVSIPEDQLSQYWVHPALKPDDLNGPGKMGCVRLGFMIDSRAGIWNPQVEAIYGDKAVADWAVGVLNGISFSPAGTNNAKRAVMTKLTLSYNHAPQDVKDWDACLAAVGKAPAAPAAVAATSPSSSSPEPSSVEAACKMPGYQCVYEPIQISLIHKDGSKYSMTFPPPMPIIQPAYMTIFPGQTLYIEADLDGDKLTNLKLVPSVAHREKTLTLKFSQENVGGTSMMMFDISNPFSKPMKYRAGMMPLDQPGTEDHVYKTSTCPVIAKGGAFETWPEPLFQLVIADMRLIDPNGSEAGVCD